MNVTNSRGWYDPHTYIHCPQPQRSTGCSIQDDTTEMPQQTSSPLMTLELSGLNERNWIRNQYSFALTQLELLDAQYPHPLPSIPESLRLQLHDWLNSTMKIGWQGVGKWEPLSYAISTEVQSLFSQTNHLPFLSGSYCHRAILGNREYLSKLLEMSRIVLTDREFILDTVLKRPLSGPPNSIEVRFFVNGYENQHRLGNALLNYFVNLMPDMMAHQELMKEFLVNQDPELEGKLSNYPFKELLTLFVKETVFYPTSDVVSVESGRVRLLKPRGVCLDGCLNKELPIVFAITDSPSGLLQELFLHDLYLPLPYRDLTNPSIPISPQGFSPWRSMINFLLGKCMIANSISVQIIPWSRLILPLIHGQTLILCCDLNIFAQRLITQASFQSSTKNIQRARSHYPLVENLSLILYDIVYQEGGGDLSLAGPILLNTYYQLTLAVSQLFTPDEWDAVFKKTLNLLLKPPFNDELSEAPPTLSWEEFASHQHPLLREILAFVHTSQTSVQCTLDSLQRRCYTAMTSRCYNPDKLSLSITEHAEINMMALTLIDKTLLLPLYSKISVGTSNEEIPFELAKTLNDWFGFSNPDRIETTESIVFELSSSRSQFNGKNDESTTSLSNGGIVHSLRESSIKLQNQDPAICQRIINDVLNTWSTNHCQLNDESLLLLIQAMLSLNEWSEAIATHAKNMSFIICQHLNNQGQPILALEFWSRISNVDDNFIASMQNEIGRTLSLIAKKHYDETKDLVEVFQLMIGLEQKHSFFFQPMLTSDPQFILDLMEKSLDDQGALPYVWIVLDCPVPEEKKGRKAELDLRIYQLSFQAGFWKSADSALVELSYDGQDESWIRDQWHLFVQSLPSEELGLIAGCLKYEYNCFMDNDEPCQVVLDTLDRLLASDIAVELLLKHLLKILEVYPVFINNRGQAIYDLLNRSQNVYLWVKAWRLLNGNQLKNPVSFLYCLRPLFSTISLVHSSEQEKSIAALPAMLQSYEISDELLCNIWQQGKECELTECLLLQLAGSLSSLSPRMDFPWVQFSFELLDRMNSQYQYQQENSEIAPTPIFMAASATSQFLCSFCQLNNLESDREKLDVAAKYIFDSHLPNLWSPQTKASVYAAFFNGYLPLIDFKNSENASERIHYFCHFVQSLDFEQKEGFSAGHRLVQKAFDLLIDQSSLPLQTYQELIRKLRSSLPPRFFTGNFKLLQEVPPRGDDFSLHSYYLKSLMCQAERNTPIQNGHMKLVDKAIKAMIAHFELLSPVAQELTRDLMQMYCESLILFPRAQSLRKLPSNTLPKNVSDLLQAATKKGVYNREGVTATTMWLNIISSAKLPMKKISVEERIQLVTEIITRLDLFFDLKGTLAVKQYALLENCTWVIPVEDRLKLKKPLKILLRSLGTNPFAVAPKRQSLFILTIDLMCLILEKDHTQQTRQYFFDLCDKGLKQIQELIGYKNDVVKQKMATTLAQRYLQLKTEWEITPDVVNGSQPSSSSQ